MLTNALVMPHFDYCNTVWSNCSVELSHSLQVLLNRLTRILLNADIITPVADLLYSLNWCKLERRWETQLLVEVFKCLKGLAPSYLSNQFSFTESMQTECTRSQSSKTLCVPPWNNDQGKRTFLYWGAKVWNKLSPHVRSNYDSMNMQMFKNAIV